MPALKNQGRPSNARWLSTVLPCRSDQESCVQLSRITWRNSFQQLQERPRVAEILEDLVSSTAAKRRHVSGPRGNGDRARPGRDRTSDIEWGITHYENSPGIDKFRTVDPRALDRDWYQ